MGLRNDGAGFSVFDFGVEDPQVTQARLAQRARQDQFMRQTPQGRMASAFAGLGRAIQEQSGQRRARAAQQTFEDAFFSEAESVQGGGGTAAQAQIAGFRNAARELSAAGETEAASRVLQQALQFEQAEELRQAQIGKLKADANRDAVKAAEDAKDRRLSAENTLRDDFRAEAKDLIEIQSQVGNVLAAVERGTAGGDVATIFAFMKALDPRSVVREGEQETVRATGAISDRLANSINRFITGETLTNTQRQDLALSIIAISKPRLDELNQVSTRFRDLAVRNELDPEAVVTRGLFLTTTEAEQRANALTEPESSGGADDGQPEPRSRLERAVSGEPDADVAAALEGLGF